MWISLVLSHAVAGEPTPATSVAYPPEAAEGWSRIDRGETGSAFQLGRTLPPGARLDANFPDGVLPAGMRAFVLEDSAWQGVKGRYYGTINASGLVVDVNFAPTDTSLAAKQALVAKLAALFGPAAQQLTAGGGALYVWGSLGHGFMVDDSGGGFILGWSSRSFLRRLR